MKNHMNRRQFLAYSATLATGVLAGCEKESPIIKPASITPLSKPFDELLDYDALGLAELLKTKQISQLELVEVVIKRIEHTNPQLNYMTNTLFDRARKLAGSVDLNTPFAGVPVLMKDMIDVGGVIRTDGSKLLANNIPEKNVLYVDGLERAGLNIIGMTNVPELASYIMTDNDLFGATRNPWNLDYSPFSSSGGSAAAVAAGVLPLVHGTDGAGSNRLPTSCTGLLGMKATRKRMLSGEAHGGHDRTKTNQSIGRSVRDSAALFDCTEDKESTIFQPMGFVQGPSDRRLKVGYVEDFKTMVPIEPEVKAAVADTAKLMASLGHNVEVIAYPFDYEQLYEGVLAFFLEKFGQLKSVVESATGTTVKQSGLLTPWLTSGIEYYQTFNVEKLAASKVYLNKVSGLFDQVFADYDVILSPVSPVAGVSFIEASINDSWNDETLHFMLSRMAFTAPVNFGGLPAMSVPLGWGGKGGLPIGSHFIADRGHDPLLYKLAYELERAKPWHNQWAPVSLKYPVQFAKL